MITAADLRAAYVPTGSTEDEFIGRDDAFLTIAISRAYDTIARYISPMPETACLSAWQRLDNIALTLARANALDDARFPDDDPVIRDKTEAMAWLLNVAKGMIRLDCPEVATDARNALSIPVASSVIAPPAVFTGSVPT